MKGFEPPGHCPVCGEFVPSGAHACPDCGSCARSGWSGDEVYDGLNLPETDEPSEGAAPKRSAGRSLWSAIALALLGLLVVYLLGRR